FEPKWDPISDGVFFVRSDEAGPNVWLRSNGTEVPVTSAKPPTLFLPPPVRAEATAPSGAAVSYLATAQDSLGNAIPIVCSPQSGSVFPLGTTTVGCAATSRGLTAEGSFGVQVVDTTPPTIGALAANPNS